MLNVNIMCVYDQAMYMKILFLCFNNKMWCQLLKGHAHIWGLINPQERGEPKRISKRVPRGNYPCLLIPPTLLNLYYDCVLNFSLSLSVPKANHWIYVRGLGVSGHIPYLLGA